MQGRTLELRRGLEQAVEAAGDAREADLLARVHVRSGVEDEQPDAERRAAFGVGDEGAHRALPGGVVGSREVDEVGAVGQNRLAPGSPPGRHQTQSASSAETGLAPHCIWLRVKIWMADAPMASPWAGARWSPPAVGTWAPNRRRSTSGVLRRRRRRRRRSAPRPGPGASRRSDRAAGPWRAPWPGRSRDIRWRFAGGPLRRQGIRHSRCPPRNDSPPRGSARRRWSGR